MAEKKVIIIGAGLAGLATGIYARMNGYQAHIFEHANQPARWCHPFFNDGQTCGHAALPSGWQKV